MVTWSRDSTLRIWTVELTTQYQCGVDALEDTSGKKFLKILFKLYFGYFGYNTMFVLQ